MAKDSKPLSEFYKHATDTVVQTKEQVLRAVDSHFNLLQSAISSYPTGGTCEKIKNYGGKNIAATREFLHRLGQAKDFHDIVRIQTEFMQAHRRTFKQSAEESPFAQSNLTV